jgi:Pentapeptide repeats (8 copies)
VVSRQVPQRNLLVWSGLAIAAAVVVVTAVYVVFWPLSDLIARHDVGAITGRGYGAALQTARDAARGRLAAFGAGLFAAGALVYTARNFTLARQGQVTDRYTKAIEQLGSDKGIDVRIGGIYALERISRDSPRDHPTIMEVLAAFIRDHSHEQWPPAEPGVDTPARTMRPDIQAAVTVIRRRTVRYDSQPINLEAANLPEASLAGTYLAGARLTEARLTDADLTGAQLAGAELFHADLTGAQLTVAHLAGADLTSATFTGADLRGADLRGARLLGAHLDGEHPPLPHLRIRGTLLTSVRFDGADLTGADVAEVDFTYADLTGVIWSPDAVSPKGWQRDTNSGRLRRAEPQSGGAATE